MAMDLEDLYDEVRENIKRTSSAVSDARIIRWINWAQTYVTDLHTYEEMREIYTGATIDGTARYGFPTRMKDVYSMTLQDGSSSRVLEYVRARDFDTHIPRPATFEGCTHSGYGYNVRVLDAEGS